MDLTRLDSKLERDEELAEFLDVLRAAIGLKPIPDEPLWARYTLDGERKLTTAQWCEELGLTRQAVNVRRKTLLAHLKEGRSPSLAYALASARPNPLKQKNKRAEPRAGRPGSAPQSGARVCE